MAELSKIFDLMSSIYKIDFSKAGTGEDNKLILLYNKFYNNNFCKILKSRLSVANLRKKLELPNDLKIISNLEELLDRYHSINLINSL